MKGSFVYDFEQGNGMAKASTRTCAQLSYARNSKLVSNPTGAHSFARLFPGVCFSNVRLSGAGTRFVGNPCSLSRCRIARTIRLNARQGKRAARSNKKRRSLWFNGLRFSTPDQRKWRNVLLQAKNTSWSKDNWMLHFLLRGSARLASKNRLINVIFITLIIK